MRRLLGILFVLAAGVSFGFMPLFKRWVVEADPTVSTAMLLMLRFGIASAILLPLIAVRRLPMPKGRVLAGYVVMGCLGYFGEAYCFFGALNHIPGGLVSLLLYTYPAFVTVGAWMLFGERPSTWTLASLAVASAGMAMTILPTLTGTSEPSPGASRVMGVVLGLGTAVIYGAYVLGGTALSRRFEGPLQSSFIVMSSATAAFAGVVLWHREPLPTAHGVWVAAASLAVVGSVIAITSLLAGLAILGPVKTSALSLVEPLATVLIGATFLHERLAPVQLAGGGLILLGAALSIRRPASSSAERGETK